MWMQYNVKTHTVIQTPAKITFGTNNSNLNCQNSPCAAIINGMIVLAYQDDDSNNMKMATYDFASGTWTSQGSFMTSSLQTNHSGAMTAYQGGIYLATVDNSTNQVCLWYYDSNTLGWSAVGAISASATTIPPAITTDGNLIYLTWSDSGSSSHKISWCTFDPSASQFSTPAHITTDASSPKNPQSNQGICLAATQEIVYMMYSDGDNSDHVRWAYYNIANGKWYGDANVLVMTSGGNVSYPQTTHTPFLCLGDNLGMLLYRGQGSSNIFYAYY